MTGPNDELTALLMSITALEPAGEDAEAQAAYYYQLASLWYQVATLLARNSVATDELVSRHRQALTKAGIDPARALN